MAIALGLFLLMLSSEFGAQQNWPGVAFCLAVGLSFYLWAENVRQRPLFLWVPILWLGFQLLLGPSLKGEGLLLGLPLFLIVSSLLRRHYNRQENPPGEANNPPDSMPGST